MGDIAFHSNRHRRPTPAKPSSVANNQTNAKLIHDSQTGQVGLFIWGGGPDDSIFDQGNPQNSMGWYLPHALLESDTSRQVRSLLIHLATKVDDLEIYYSDVTGRQNLAGTF